MKRPPEKHWLTLSTYAARYDVHPRTVMKWAEAGLVIVAKVQLHGKRAMVRVKNQAPAGFPTT